jgi:4-diphosphocytidyl-2C-methyl-D-erythritol kinase
LDVVPAPVEVADKVAENMKVTEAGAESGEANVENEKSDYIRRSIWSGKGPTVCGFYKERAAAASAKEKQQNKCDTNKNKETSKKKRRRSRSSSSFSSSSSNVSSSVSVCHLDLK